MNYTKIDLSTWKRGTLFKFYIDKMRVVMSLTVEIDVAPLIEYVKKNGLNFYPAMIWVVSKVINSCGEFKYGWDGEGNLIKWDYISPSYAHFYREDEAFVKSVTEYSETFTQDFCPIAPDMKTSAGSSEANLRTFST